MIGAGAALSLPLVGELVTAVIRAAVAARSGEVAGGLTRANTAYLAEALRGGRLPGRVTIVGREPAACATP